jgi:ATP-binding cassette subfamily B protein
VAQETARTETAFTKACSYLDYHKKAKWVAHIAAAGTAVVGILLLVILWLFADLLDWRGRIPSTTELSRKQTTWLETQWAKTDQATRQEIVEATSVPANLRNKVIAQDFLQLTRSQREAVWQEIVRRMLEDYVGTDAVDYVFVESDENPNIKVIDEGDHGILSLVVREISSGQLVAVSPLLARYNRWMWNDRANEQSLLSPYLTGLALVFLILGLIWAFLLVLNREMAARAVIEATSRLRRAVYHHSFRLGTLAVRALGPSEAVTILTRHIESVHDALYTHLTIYYRELFVIGALLLFAVAVHPALSLAFILFAVLLWQAGLRISAVIRAQSDHATTVAGERLTIIRESLMMMRLVKCYLMESFNGSRIERQLVQYGQAQRERHRGESITVPAIVVLTGLCALILFYVGGLLILSGQLTMAGALVLAVALLSVFRPLGRLLESLKLLKRGKDAAEQVFDFLERKGEVGQVVGADFLPPLEKLLEFDNVTLRDPSTNRALLSDVTLTIRAGERIGLVGADNLEKHALVYLIPRLLDPTTGEIRIDKHNLRWVTLESLRHQIGIVMMHNLVFHDSIKNNIGTGDNNYTLPQIVEAAKIARAHSFIQKLPGGYDTLIGEQGHHLSLSEQYRIALARAILRDPAILIIEEPETEFDDETKALIDDTMVRILPKRTAIFLPHRISTLKSCTQIHLLTKGQIVASGTHKALHAENKLYRHLHYLEFNEMDELL